MNKKQVISYLVLILMLFTSFNTFSLVTTVFADDPPPGGDGSIPSPVLEGYVLDGYAVSNINVSVNKSHFHFENEYINETLEHIDFFVPEELQDDFSYVTPCNPDLMVCQIGNAPDPIYGYWDLFHILNDWTNEYGDRFYIETDYIFTYAMYDPDGDIPENFNWVRINQEIRVNYSQNNTGLGDLLNTIVDIDALRSIRINVSSDYNNLVLNYTYFYDDEIVGQFEDNYLSYTLPISDEITIQGNSLNATIDKNESTVKLVSGNGTANMTVSLDKGLPTGWVIENTTFTQNYSDGYVSFYPVEINNQSGLEFLLELNEQPVENTINFSIDAPGLEFVYLGNNSYDVIQNESNKAPGEIYRPKLGFHIYRPKIIDADNNWVWGNLSIEDGVMDLTIPQSFLDSAVYPIKVDPTYTVFSGANGATSLSHQRKMARQSNGTLWCTFEESADVHVAWSEDNGATWEDYEVFGTTYSFFSSIAVDSNDVVHLVFSSFKSDSNDMQLEYSNSSDWSTIVQIRDEDKHHEHPAIAIDSNDNIHIVYEKGEEGTSNDDQVAYINSMDNGGTWGTEQILTDEPDDYDDAWFPSIAIDSNDVIHVVFHCTDHFVSGTVYDDILHIKSSDYGNTWSNWECDPVYQDAHNEQFPVIAIDDNDKLHVVWAGQVQYSSEDQVGYSHNDSGSWSSVEWITWNPDVDSQRPSISVNDNDYIHCVFQVKDTRVDHSVNDTSSWSNDTVLSNYYTDVNMLFAQHPTIAGAKTNRPKTGYAFIACSSNITFHASSDLTWDGPANTAPTVNNNYPVNNSVDQSLKPQCVVWVNDTDNDDLDCTWQSNVTDGSTWVQYAQNLTQSANTKINYTFQEFNTESTKYWYRVYADDTTDNTSNTFCFTTASNNTAPTLSGETPVNHSTGISLTPVLNVTVDDADDDTLTAYWHSNSSGTTSENWWNNSFSDRKLITINSTQVGATLNNFPILVYRNADSDLSSNAQPDGDDICFVLHSDNSTKLNHEIENYTSGTLWSWVNITSISSSVDTNIWMYYGNATCGSQENIVGTWNSDYIGVWHLSETSGNVNDSTSNANHGTVTDATGGATGIVNGAYSFDGTSDYIDCGTNPITGTDAFTLEAFIKTDTVSKYTGAVVIGASGTGQSAYVGTVAGAQVGTANSIGGGFYGRNYGSGTTTLTAFVHTVMTFSGGASGTGLLYTNGVQKITDTYTPNLASTYIRIGRIGSDTGYDFDGIGDEARISSISRNISWIGATYNTTNSPSTFLSVGSGENQTIGGWSLFATNSSIDTSGGAVNIIQTNSNFSEYNTTYYWRVIVDDGTDSKSNTFCFTTVANNTAPTMDSFNIDNDDGMNAGWDGDNNDAQMDWTTTDDDADPVTIYITFNKGSIARLPTTGDYDFHIQDDDASNLDCDWTGGTWSDYDGAIHVRIRAHDGTEYSNTQINDTLANGIDGTNPTGTVDEYGTENPDSIEGDSADATSGVASNDIIIHDTTDDNYWTGSEWGSSAWLDCTGTTSWSYDSSGVSWDSGHEITVTLRIYDVAGNVDASADTEGFTTNTVPTVEEVYPDNNSVDQSLKPQCVVWVNDTDNDDLDCTWQSNVTDGSTWVQYAQNLTQSANTKINYTFQEFNTESTKYWYRVYADDTTDNTSNTFCFTTASNNTAPTLSGESPVNSSTGISITPSLHVICTDADSDTMTVTWRSNSSGSWVDFATNTSISTTDNITQTNSNFSAYSTTYYWSINCTDATDWTNETYHFTTLDEFLWIDITNSSWSLGNVLMGSSTFTNETGITFIAGMDNTTVNTDLKLQITNDATDWSAATSGNGADVNTYRLNASIDIWVADDNQIIVASATTISSDITAGQNETFDLRFDAPTASTTGVLQTITTTATLVKH